MDLRTILLVEDDPRDVELTLEAMGEYNLANQVVTASDGMDALDYLHCRGRFADRPPGIPAVILLDIKMPRMNGVEALREIKASLTFRHIPVVMLTSSREERDLTACYELGVNAYVVKPVQFLDFISAVKEVGVFWAVLNVPPPAMRNT